MICMSFYVHQNIKYSYASNIWLTWKTGCISQVLTQWKVSPVHRFSKFHTPWKKYVSSDYLEFTFKFFHMLIPKIFAGFSHTWILPVNLLRHPRQSPGTLLQPHNKWQKCFWQMEPTEIHKPISKSSNEI